MTIADIQSGHVMIVGRLGVPLGTAVLVTGSWQREQSLSAVPRNAPRLQLLVYSVDGRKLDEPLLFPDVVRCDLYGLDDKQRMSNEANSLPQEFRVFERIDYTGAPAKIYPSEEPPGDFPGFAAVGSICVHLAILPSEDEETGEESVPL
ncbi:MAG: hypothetical protein NTX48_06835 [Planctomycetales bacterium]|nr:hypothetical protein [Planctomycetales bacterium]